LSPVAVCYPAFTFFVQRFQNSRVSLFSFSHSLLCMSAFHKSDCLAPKTAPGGGIPRNDPQFIKCHFCVLKHLEKSRCANEREKIHLDFGSARDVIIMDIIFYLSHFIYELIKRVSDLKMTRRSPHLSDLPGQRLGSDTLCLNILAS